MSIYEVTNLDTGAVEIVSAVTFKEVTSYFPRVKIAALGKPFVAYYTQGVLSNGDGPAIIYDNGDKEWWFNGKLHNENGPAIIWNTGHVEYLIDDKLHNENGPAIIWSDGSKEWYINNNPMTEEKFNEYLRSK